MAHSRVPSWAHQVRATAEVHRLAHAHPAAPLAACTASWNRASSAKSGVCTLLRCPSSPSEPSLAAIEIALSSAAVSWRGWPVLRERSLSEALSA